MASNLQDPPTTSSFSSNEENEGGTIPPICIPVETILKVEENDFVMKNQSDISLSLSSNYEIKNIEKDWPRELPLFNHYQRSDYKTRNKLKTKERRLDPGYRSEERVRQRAMMQMKRQNPQFRDAEREKGRYRMRLKRLDPAFRMQERERQRERMKIKRSDPGFREKEREQQKSRLHIKRLDPEFREKERAQDRLRMQLKRHGDSMYSEIHSNKFVSSPVCEEDSVSEDQLIKCVSSVPYIAVDECNKKQSVFPENFSAKLLAMKGDLPLDSFHFKKQHILNFNFYNTYRDQWPFQSSPCPEAGIPFISPVIPKHEILTSINCDIKKKEDITTFSRAHIDENLSHANVKIERHN